MGQQLSKDLSDPEVTFTVFPQFFFSFLSKIIILVFAFFGFWRFPAFIDLWLHHSSHCLHVILHSSLLSLYKLAGPLIRTIMIGTHPKNPG